MTPFQVPEGPYSIERIMESIRTQIVEAPKAPAEAPPEPPTPRVLDGSTLSSIRSSVEEITRVAQLDIPYRIRSHRRILGFFIDPIKRLIHWGSRPYAELVREKQSSLNLSLVAALSSIAKELDRLDAITNRLDGESNQHETRLKRLDARHDIGPLMSSIPAQKRLEGLDRTRGKVEDIGNRQFHYIEIFDKAPGQILDIGCGRGELLVKLREHGTECFGAEVDPLMVEKARAAGVTVHEMDGIEALRRAAPGTLGGIFAGQVVEHLFPGELGEMLMLARQKLAPGARIVLETVNVSSPAAMSKSFYGDMDHKLPLHPEYLKLLLELIGFEQVELHYSAPFNAEERIADLPPAHDLGISREAHKALQGVVDQINSRVFGMQDYYVVGTQGPQNP